jgi:hypothetical protein
LAQIENTQTLAPAGGELDGPSGRAPLRRANCITLDDASIKDLPALPAGENFAVAFRIPAAAAGVPRLRLASPAGIQPQKTFQAR